ncbi:MAG: hypothetical protein LBV45_03125 [Xanthomonadaceae bacterium]|jgi:hypothetical protein|nr:hypothetical protein [Xanthomonadaceae bacterium]
MYWLFLLLACGALMLAFTTSHVWLLVVALLAGLGFFLAWAYGWYSARVGENQQDEISMIHPAELQRLRQLAEVRKQEEQAKAAPGPSEIQGKDSTPG